jgi:hypothetical protein
MPFHPRLERRVRDFVEVLLTEARCAAGGGTARVPAATLS